jgi:hypothetical protein
LRSASYWTSSACCCFHRGLGDLQARLVGKLLDREQGGASWDPVAVLVSDLLEEPLHAGDQVDLVEGGRVARQLHVEGDRLDQWFGDADFRRRRRLILIAVLTRCQRKAG